MRRHFHRDDATERVHNPVGFVLTLLRSGCCACIEGVMFLRRAEDGSEPSGELLGLKGLIFLAHHDRFDNWTLSGASSGNCC